jgi:signal peptidase
MRIIRILGSIALWIGALLGVAAGAVWLADQLGYAQPMIVISGSMEPGIMTGDLLIDRWIPTSSVEVGDVLSLESNLTGKLVTHRVVTVSPLDPDGIDARVAGFQGTDSWQITMKGDANSEPDLEPYIVGDRVLTPLIQVPMAGKVVSKLMEPTVAMPVLLALIALLGLSLLDEEPRKVVRRVVNRVRQRDPRVDDLDAELAAVGIDVTRLQDMDDLDLQLYALGIDVELADAGSEPEPRPDHADDTVPMSRNGRGFDDGLWGLSLPPSDGIELVRTPSSTATEPTPPPPETEPTKSAEPDRRAEPTPARSG